jgi:hypothetical protein
MEASLQIACSGEGAFMDCACLKCHTTAFDPVQGAYAHGGVTCEACHGAYVEDHAGSDLMTLTTDASLCQSCHIDTHDQWLGSPHAQANVPCTSCHQVHSQDLRLTDQELCDSCHRDGHQGPVHAAHVGRGANCVDCHLSTAYEPKVPEDADYELISVAGRGIVPSHDFTVSNTEACVVCHTEGAGLQGAVHSVTLNEQASRLALELDQTKEENRSLQTLSLVALGAGLGIGALLGVIFVLAVGFVCRGRGQQ